MVQRLAHFERVQQVTRTGSWEWDLISAEVVWSDQVYALLGVSPGAFDPSYERFLEFVHPLDRGIVDGALRRALSGAPEAYIDHRIVTQQAETRWVRLVGFADFDSSGCAVRVTGAIADVTEQLEAEAARRETQQMLDSLLRGSPEAIIVTNQSAKIMLFSAGAEAMFGYSSAEVEGQDIELLLPEAQRAAHRGHVQAFAAASDDTLLMHQRAEIRGRRKNGEIFPAEASLKKLAGQGQRVFTAIVRDLTAIRATEQRLVDAREAAERANRAKSSFLANMSHEIRTPLNGVLGITSALSRSDLSASQREMVDLIGVSGRALEGLLSDILDLAKVEAGHIEIQSAPVDMARLAHETAALFQARATDKGLRIIVNLACEAGARFYGDELRIRQVLSNLLSNAIKFTSQGQVTLSLSCAAVSDAESEALVQCEVSDTGMGFDPELAPQLFRRFEQGDASITRQFGGTGLGLAISRALVELMGGSIGATSRPGEGSTFSFQLPMRPCPRGGAPQTELRPEMLGSADQPLRILLAEDHPINQRTVELLLSDLPVELTCVADGQQALDTLARQSFDVVLMDMQMPVMDGLTAVREIRRREAQAGGGRIPICVVTANALETHRLESFAAGADEVITKPLNAERLISYLFFEMTPQA